MQHLRLRQIVDVLSASSAIVYEDPGSPPCASAGPRDPPASSSWLEKMNEIVESELRQRHLVSDMARAQRSTLFGTFTAGLEKILERTAEDRRRREADDAARRAALETKYRQSLAHLRGARLAVAQDEAV